MKKTNKSFFNKMGFMFCFLMLSFMGIAQTTKTVAISVTEQGASQLSVGTDVKFYDADFIYSVNEWTTSSASPLSFQNVPVGTYTYEIFKPCSQILTGTFTISENDNSVVNLSYTLIPSGITTANIYFGLTDQIVDVTIKSGTTTIASKRIEADWMDGSKQIITNVPFGSYSVTLHSVSDCRQDITYNNVVVGCSTLDIYNSESPTVPFFEDMGAPITSANLKFFPTATGESQITDPITVTMTGINGTITMDPIVFYYDLNALETTITDIPFGEYSVKYEGACRATTYTTLTVNCAGRDAQTGDFPVNNTIGALGSGTGAVFTDTPSICPTIGATTTITATPDFASVTTYAWQTRKPTALNLNPAWKTIAATATTTTVAAGTIYTNYNTATLGITKASAIVDGVQYRVVATGTNTCGTVGATASSTPVTIDVYDVLKPGTATAPVAICNHGYVDLSLTGNVGTNVQWQWSTDKTNWSSAGIYGSTFYAEDWGGVDYATAPKYYFRAAVSDSRCGTTVYTGVKTVKVDRTTIPGTATGSALVCSMDSGITKNTIKLTGYVGKIQWEYSTDEGLNWVPVPAGTALLPATADGFLSLGTGKSASLAINSITRNLLFRAAVTSGTCYTEYSNTVSFTGAVSTATQITASADNICPATGVTLTVGEGYIGNIQWMKSTNGIDFLNWGNNKGTASKATGNLAVTTYYKAIFSIGGSCDSASSDIYTVHVLPRALAKPITGNSFTGTPTPDNGSTALKAICTTGPNALSKVLTMATGQVGVIQWQTVVTASTLTVAPTTGWGACSGTNNGQSYTITTPAAGLNWFRVMMVTGEGCTPAYSAVFKVYYEDTCSGTNRSVIQEGTAPFTVVAYPNPYSENFNLSLSTTSEAKVGFIVYDMTGRLIEQNEVTPSEVSELRIGDHYPSGIYNLIVTQGTEVKTLRMIKR